MLKRPSWIWCWMIGAVLAAGASAQQYATIIDNLPQCVGNRNGRIISVSDATSDSDCAVGGATGEDRFVHPCVCDTLNALGPYWKAVGGGGGDLSAYALLAGDADGQTIQGVTGSDRPRLAMDGEGASLYGVGAAPSSLQILEGEAFLSSGDAESYVDIADGYVSVVSNGYIEVIANELKIISSQTPPTNANDTCTAGNTILTATFLYYCYTTDTWVRVAMATWP